VRGSDSDASGINPEALCAACGALSNLLQVAEPGLQQQLPVLDRGALAPVLAAMSSCVGHTGVLRSESGLGVLPVFKFTGNFTACLPVASLGVAVGAGLVSEEGGGGGGCPRHVATVTGSGPHEPHWQAAR
jgi:hypothetical protein